MCDGAVDDDLLLLVEQRDHLPLRPDCPLQLWPLTRIDPPLRMRIDPVKPRLSRATVLVG